MKKIFKKSIIALMVVLFSATLSIAKGPKGPHGGYDGDGNPDCPYNTTE